MAALTLDEILNSDKHLGRATHEHAFPSIASPISFAHDPVAPMSSFGFQSEDALGIIRSDEIFVNGRNTAYASPQVDAYTIPSRLNPYGIADRTGSLKVSDHDNIFANRGQPDWSAGVQNPDIYLDRVGSVLNNYGHQSMYGNQGLLSEPPAIGISPIEVSYPTKTVSLNVNGREELFAIGEQPDWSTGVKNPGISFGQEGIVLNACGHGSIYANDGILSSRSPIDTQAFQVGISGLGMVENETQPYAARANMGVANPLQNLIQSDGTLSAQVSDHDNIFANRGQPDWSAGVQNPDIYLDRVGSVLNNYGHQSMYGNQGLLSEPPAIGISPIEVSYPTKTVSLNVNGREELFAIGEQPDWSQLVRGTDLHSIHAGNVVLDAHSYLTDEFSSRWPYGAANPIIVSHEEYGISKPASNLFIAQDQIVFQNQFHGSPYGIVPPSVELPIREGELSDILSPIVIDSNSAPLEPGHPFILSNKFNVIVHALDTLNETAYCEKWEDVWAAIDSGLRDRKRYACLSMRTLIENVTRKLAPRDLCDAWAQNQKNSLNLLDKGKPTRRAKWIFIVTGCGSRLISKSDLDQTERAVKDYRDLNRIHNLTFRIPMDEVEELLIRQGLFLQWLINSWSRNLA